MRAGGMPPGRDPPIRAEIIHESPRTRVARLFLPDGTVVRKEPLGPDARLRLRRELAFLERLRGAPGVAQLLESRDTASIMLADGGSSLTLLAKPLAADHLVRLAAELARAVAALHRRGVMHRDVSPANIVISDDGVPCLVDFALAAPVAEFRPEFTHHTEIAGTLAYLAPESTGRTGRPADHRADLYAVAAGGT